MTGRGWAWLAVFVLAVAAAALIGSLATTAHVDGWYADAPKPPWTPPNWLFAPMWSVLYLGMAVAGWHVWRSTDRRRRAALALFWTQLGLNALWTPIFFAGYPVWGPAALWIAAGVIVALDAVVAACAIVFRGIDRFAAWVMVVSLAWLLYATSLNVGVAALGGR